MSIDEKTTMSAEKQEGIAPAVEDSSDAYCEGEILKIDEQKADPALALVSGERIEYSEDDIQALYPNSRKDGLRACHFV